jgi:hypothetical protein
MVFLNLTCDFGVWKNTRKKFGKSGLDNAASHDPGCAIGIPAELVENIRPDPSFSASMEVEHRRGLRETSVCRYLPRAWFLQSTQLSFSPMKKKSVDEQYSEQETVERREAALRRMLSTPHQPHRPRGKSIGPKAKRSRPAAKPK